MDLNVDVLWLGQENVSFYNLDKYMLECKEEILLITNKYKKARKV